MPPPGFARSWALGAGCWALPPAFPLHTPDIAQFIFPPNARDDMNILWMILLGLIAGAIAKLIMPGKDPGGIFVTILLGIAGSLLGGFLWGMIGGEGGAAGLIGSVVGALILLAIYRMVVGRRRTV